MTANDINKNAMYSRKGCLMTGEELLSKLDMEYNCAFYWEIDAFYLTGEQNYPSFDEFINTIFECGDAFLVESNPVVLDAGDLF